MLIQLSCSTFILCASMTCGIYKLTRRTIELRNLLTILHHSVVQIYGLDMLRSKSLVGVPLLQSCDNILLQVASIITSSVQPLHMLGVLVFFFPF